MPTTETIGSLKVGRELGQWGQHVLYNGVDHEDGRAVVLTTLHEGLKRDTLRRATFERDLGRISKVTHANLLRPLDVVYDDDGAAWLVSKAPLGRPIRSLIPPSGLPADVACDIGLQVLAGLAAAHEAALVHGSLSPDNVIVQLDRPDQPRATLLGVGASGSGLGGELPGWSADSGLVPPEVARGGAFSVRGDVYLAGALMYHMLVGAPMSRSVTADRIAITMVQRNPRIPESLARAIEWALCPNPEERMSAPQDFARQLVPYLHSRQNPESKWVATLDPVLRMESLDPDQMTSASLQLNRAPRPRPDSHCPEAMLLDPAFPRAPGAPRLDSLHADAFGPRPPKVRPPTKLVEPEQPKRDGSRGAAAVAMGTGAGLGAVLAWLSAII